MCKGHESLPKKGETQERGGAAQNEPRGGREAKVDTNW